MIRRSVLRKYMRIYCTALIIAILFNAFIIIFPSNVKAIPLPGEKSLMKLFDSGKIKPEEGSFDCGEVKYYVYKSYFYNFNHWIGKVWSDKWCWFSDIVYHRTTIKIEKGRLPGDPDCGDDPYCNLPVDEQTWRYKSSDGFSDGDAIGTIPPLKTQWIALPETSVPHDKWRTFFWDTSIPIWVHFKSGYGSCRNWDDMRVGVGSQ